MEKYIEASNYISSLVLQYVAPEGFHTTASLHLFADIPEELTHKIVNEIYQNIRLTQLLHELDLISYWRS